MKKKNSIVKHLSDFSVKAGDISVEWPFNELCYSLCCHGDALVLHSEVKQVSESEGRK